MANNPHNHDVTPKKYNFCTSQLKETNEKFVWTIDNFSKRQKKVGEHLQSTIFISTTPNGWHLKWRMKLFPNGVEEAAKDHVSIFLVLIGSNKPEVLAKFVFFIRDTDGDENEICRSNVFSNFGNLGSNEWGYDKLIKRDDDHLKENGLLLPGDCLTVVCELTVQEEEVKKAPLPDVLVPECRALKDVSQLFEQSLFTDFRIIAGDGKEFKVHKCILGCRSPVFAAMFEHEMVEKNNNVVEIGEIDSNVIEQMLRFIYSGKASKFGEMAEDMMVAADKYQLSRLKLLCERELAQTMRNENACELLVMAKRHSANDLKEQAIKFIRRQATEVLASKGWDSMVKDVNNVELVKEVMKAIAERK